MNAAEGTQAPPATGSDTAPGEPNGVDDAFRALLEGIRTTLPGVQVLFAFLLALPLQSAFGDLAAGQRTAYTIAFMGSALSSVLLIAPSAHQRLRALFTGVTRRSERHLQSAVRMTIAGTLLFVISLSAAVHLVTTLLLPSALAAAATAMVAALAAWSWFYVPLVSFSRQ